MSAAPPALVSQASQKLALRGVIVGFAGAGAAEGAAVGGYFAVEVDALAAFGADHSWTFEARKILRFDFDFYPLGVKENFVGELRVGFLLAFFPGEIGKEFTGGLFGGLLCGDTDGATGLQITEGSGYFAPVAEFQGAFAEAAVGNERDSIRNAAVDFDISDDAFAFGNGVGDAEFAQTEHGQANTENLASTDVAVGYGGEFEIFGEGFHCKSDQRSL